MSPADGGEHVTAAERAPSSDGQAAPEVRTGAARIVSGVASARTFESLHNRDFRWFLLALLSQNAAMNIQLLARGFLVFELTGSYAALGTMALFHALSMLGLSLYGGILADRRSKRLVLQGGQVAAAVTSGAVAVLLFADLLRYEYLLIAAFTQGATSGLMMPARQAMAPEIVGREGLQNAVALNTAGMNVMRLLGPAFAGFMLAIADPEWVYVIMTALFALSVLTLSRVPKREPVATAQQSGSAADELREGFAYILRTPTVLLLLAFSFITSFLAMPYIRILPGFVADVLDGGSAQLGLLMSIGGLGALTGALTLASLPPRHRGKLLLLSAAVMGVGLVGFAASSMFVASFALMFVVGVGASGRQALNNVLIQTHVDDAYRGRVMSVFMMQVGTMSFGAFAVGVIAEFAGPQIALGSFAVALIAFALAVYVLVPSVRDVE